MDKQVQARVVCALESWLKDLEYDWTRCKADLFSYSVSLENFMRTKRGWLIRWAEGFPLNSDTCYFCEVHHFECDKCAYAATHGPCGSRQSDWQCISRAVDDLVCRLHDYYRGETYTCLWSDLQADTVIRLLIEQVEKTLSTLRDFIQQMAETDTVEQLMRVKRELLIYYVNGITLSRSTCPFCRKYTHCDPCEYRLNHGICEDLSSDYAQIRGAKGNLELHLWNYYRGERYAADQLAVIRCLLGYLRPTKQQMAAWTNAYDPFYGGDDV